MANFQGHLHGAALVSGGAALGAYSLGWVDQGQTQWLFFIGVVGGVLPDIDSDNSVPVRSFFTLVGVMLAFWMSFFFIDRLPGWTLLPLWAGVFLSVRYGIFEIFTRLTVHRGIWHSLLALLFSALAGVNLTYHFFHWKPWDAWLAGLFIALGYLTHLLLDELFSVDLLGRRLKQSFGSAMKPFSLAYPWTSLSMLAATLVLLFFSPPIRAVVQAGEYYGLEPQSRAQELRTMGNP